MLSSVRESFDDHGDDRVCWIVNATQPWYQRLHDPRCSADDWWRYGDWVCRGQRSFDEFSQPLCCPHERRFVVDWEALARDDRAFDVCVQRFIGDILARSVDNDPVETLECLERFRMRTPRAFLLPYGRRVYLRALSAVRGLVSPDPTEIEGSSEPDDDDV